MARNKGEKAGGEPKASQPEVYKIGRPLQSRLVALEMKIGLFSNENSYGEGNRFNHPVTLSADAPIPPGMDEVFAEEIAEIRRLNGGEVCHQTDLKPYRVSCLTYFHYDGFRALLYAERNGSMIAAWKEAEVAYPDSPRALYAGENMDKVEAFLDAALAD